MGYRQKVLQVLREARAALASSPSSWCQGSYARDYYGSACGSFDVQALSWCAVGAVHVVADRLTGGAGQEWGEVSDGAVRCLADAAVPGWRLPSEEAETVVTTENDHAATTHADVLRWFELAIARAERDAATGVELAALVAAAVKP